MLSSLAVLSGNPDAYLNHLLANGLLGLDRTNYWSIPAERRDVFVENARARYTDIIASARRGLG